MEQTVQSSRPTPRSEGWLISLLEGITNFLRGRPALFLLPVRDSEPEREKLRWLIGLRYHAILGQWLVASLAYSSGSLSLRSAVFITTVGLVFLIFNLMTHRTWARAAGRPVSARLTALQLSIDLFVLTTLLAATGGASNPFVAIFYVHAALGGILLIVRYSIVFLVLVHCSLFANQLLAIGANEQTIPWVPFAVQHIVTLMAWAITTSLGRHLRFTQERLLQLRIVNERLDRLRSLGALAAGLAHEFASPLATARIRLDRLDRKQINDREDLNEARDAIERCEGVLRTMTGSIADSREIDIEAIDLARHVERIVDGWQQQIPEREIDVRVSVRPLMRLPALNLAQSLLNLLDNAHEASPANEKVYVSVAREDWDIVVSIEDRGEGFPPDVLARLGEPFNTGKAHGTGLGVYSTQLFLQSVGGELMISPRKPGEGALVQLRFPSSLEAGADVLMAKGEQA